MIPFSDGRRGLDTLKTLRDDERRVDLVSAIEDANAVLARLVALGDREADVAVIRSMRDSLQRDLDLVGRTS